ncbi:hypothetical protein L218DRAFT_800591, partial [Marasmius fiardii PR-910]
ILFSSLLQVHVPNDGQCFPGHLPSQLSENPEAEGQWKIEQILSRTGKQYSASFEILWSSGDKTWLPYFEIQDMPCIKEYFDLLG